MIMNYANGALRENLEKGKLNPCGISGAPGRDLWSTFLKHHLELAQRNPQYLTKGA